MSSTSIAAAATSVLAALLLAVCVKDATERRVPNVLVLAILGTGALATLLAGGLPALGRGGLSLLLGLGIWLPFYALKMLGAGDVKLFAAAALWLTPWQVADAALFSAFAGGALSLLWLVRQAGSQLTLLRLLTAARHPGGLGSLASAGAANARRVPYAIAMSAGLLLARFGVSLVSR